MSIVSESSISAGLRTPPGPSMENMGIDQAGLHIAVPQQLLDGENVNAMRKDVGRKRMAQGVAGGLLMDPCRLHRATNRFLLQARFQWVVTLFSNRSTSPSMLLGKTHCQPHSFATITYGLASTPDNTTRSPPSQRSFCRSWLRMEDA